MVEHLSDDQSGLRMIQGRRFSLIVSIGLCLTAVLTAAASVVHRLDDPPISPRFENALDSGIRNLDRGLYRRASIRFRKALALNPSAGQARELFSTVSALGYPLRSKPSKDSLGNLLALRPVFPKSPYLEMMIGEKYLKEGDHENARKALNQSTDLKPDIPHNWYLLSKLYRDTGQYPEAVSAAEEAVRLTGLSSYHYHLGQLYLFLGRHQRAIEEFEASLSTRTWNNIARIGLVRAELKLGNLERASAIIKEILTSIHDNPRLNTKLGKSANLISGSKEFAVTTGLSNQELTDYLQHLLSAIDPEEAIDSNRTGAVQNSLSPRLARIARFDLEGR